MRVVIRGAPCRLACPVHGVISEAVRRAKLRAGEQPWFPAVAGLDDRVSPACLPTGELRALCSCVPRAAPEALRSWPS